MQNYLPNLDISIESAFNRIAPTYIKLVITRFNEIIMHVIIMQNSNWWVNPIIYLKWAANNPLNCIRSQSNFWERFIDGITNGTDRILDKSLSCFHFLLNIFFMYKYINCNIVLLFEKSMDFLLTIYVSMIPPKSDRRKSDERESQFRD